MALLGGYFIPTTCSQQRLLAVFVPAVSDTFHATRSSGATGVPRVPGTTLETKVLVHLQRTRGGPVGAYRGDDRAERGSGTKCAEHVRPSRVAVVAVVRVGP
eukprot:471479-Rhodomonas_salina.3